MVGDDVAARMTWLKSEREAVKTQRDSLDALKADDAASIATVAAPTATNAAVVAVATADGAAGDGSREPSEADVMAARLLLQRSVDAQTAASARYGGIGFIPNPAMTLNKHGEEGLSVSRLVKGIVFRNHGGIKESSREMEWMERSGFGPDEHSLGATGTIPWPFLARYGHIESKRLKEQGQRAALSISATGAGAGGGTLSTIVDPENSMAWLYDKAPVLEKFATIPGVRGKYQFFYGSNTTGEKPNANEYAEGAAFTEGSPTFEEVELSPVTLGVTFPISSAMIAADHVGIMSIVEQGTEMLVKERLVRNVLSGTGTGAAFAVNANAMTGLMNASLTNTGYGANNAAFGRADVIDAYFDLIENKAEGSGLVWVLSTGLGKLAADKRVGGTESVRFVFEKSGGGDSPYEGMMEPGVPAVISTQLGKASTTNPGVLVYGSRVVVPIWGSGIDVIVFNDPTKGAIDLGFRLHANTRIVNPENGVTIAQS